MNSIKLVGTYDAATGTVRCKRLSDNYDIIPVQFPQVAVDEEYVPGDGERLFFQGSIINEKGNVFVGIEEAYGLNEGAADSTECELVGTIKKVYPLRITKKERKLQDMLVEAKGQLIKIVAFEACPEFIKPGILVHIKGRLQSRSFTQITTFGTVNKTVYEVALKNLEVIEVIDGKG